MFDTAFHKNTDLSKSSFLVTGGAGFIGSNLVEYLLKYGAGKVVVLDNLATGFKKNLENFVNDPRFTFIEGDIRNLEDCHKAASGVDYIFHQAALGSVPRSINDPITTNDVNIGGFLNMLVAARDANVKKFVFAASSSTYGDSLALPKVEDKIGKPLSPYAVTKYVNELYADVFGKTYGLKTIGLRYFNIYGPKQSPKGAYAAVIPLFIENIQQGKAPKINGDGEQTRDFTYVENAIQANILAALTTNEEANNQIYNIAVHERTSLNLLYNELQKIAKVNIPAEYGPNRVGDIRDSFADISKAQTLLGYDPEVKIIDGLNRTYTWFVENQEFIAR